MFLFNGRQLISRDIVAVFQIASFAVIAGQYHDAAYPTFEQARPDKGASIVHYIRRAEYDINLAT